MKKIRWIRPLDGLRQEGMIEENDDDLCATWVKGGLAEYVDDKARTQAQEDAEDLARRRTPVEEKAVKESPVDRSMKSGTTKKK